MSSSSPCSSYSDYVAETFKKMTAERVAAACESSRSKGVGEDIERVIGSFDDPKNVGPSAKELKAISMAVREAWLVKAEMKILEKCMERAQGGHETFEVKNIDTPDGGKALLSNAIVTPKPPFYYDVLRNDLRARLEQKGYTYKHFYDHQGYTCITISWK